MADEGERQNLENATADNAQNEVNLGINCDEVAGTEPTKTESVENLVDSLNLESCCIDSNQNETESDSEFDSDESEVTDEEESDEELSEGDGEEFVRLEPWTCERRHSGDGEEQPDKTTENKLDDDEDKQNPAYIPRKGSFFEHDLRLDDGVEDVETDAKLIKKKLWYDRVKWQHDKFDERSQAPKSRDEIVQVYGFDIREEKRVSFDATRQSVKKRTSKKGRGKRLGDYIVFAKPVPVSLERVKRPIEGMRQFCPRRSWPENNLRKKNIVMKSLSPETVRRSKYVIDDDDDDDKKENFPGTNDLPAAQNTSAGYDEIPPCFIQKGKDTAAERSSHNDAKRFPEKRSQTKFDPADGKLVFRSVRGNKTSRIGTGRIIGKSGPRDSPPDRYYSRHDRQSLETPNRPAKKYVGSKRMIGMDRGVPLHTMRTIRNSGTCGHTEMIETFKDAVADADGQSMQRIMSSAATKSQDVRLLETQDFPLNVSRINSSAGHETARNEKSSRGYSKGSGRKSTVTIHTTMAPDMIPPVTRIPTYTRSVESRSVRGRPVAHEASLSSDTPSESISSGTETTPSYGWSGGEFIPSEQLLPRSDASGRPKRYSSQRQKMGTESGMPELAAGQNDGGTVVSVVTMPATAGFTTSLPQRPLPAATYYGSASGTHGVPSFPHASVLPLGMSSITYTVPVSTNVGPGHIRLYNGPAIRGNPVAMATGSAPPLMHAPYLNPPGMMQGPYIGPPPVINYGLPLGPQYSVPAGSIPVQFAPGTPGPVRNPRPDGNPLEVRGGTVYFNPEVQQVDMLHGMVYFNPDRQAGNVKSPVRRAKVAIPIVKPEDVSAKEVDKEDVGEGDVEQKEVQEGVGQDEVEQKEVVKEVLQEDFGQREGCEVPESNDKEEDTVELSTECSKTPADDKASATESDGNPGNSTVERKENELSDEIESEKTAE